MATTFEVYHPSVKGVKVFVRRTTLQQIMKWASPSWMFANFNEKQIPGDQVDVYVSLIPIDSKEDVHEDLDLLNAQPDEKHPAYLLNRAIPREQVVVTFETLLASFNTAQLNILKRLVSDPNNVMIEAIKGFLVGLRLTNIINETAFLTIRFGLELQYEPFVEALNNVITRREENKQA